MKIMFHGWVPVFIFYTGLLKRAGAKSFLMGPLCLLVIHNKYKNDQGIHDHLMTHVKQHWDTGWTHYFKYRDSEKYRLISECEAYAKQLMAYPDDRHYELFVEFMLDNYELSFCEKTIKRELDRQLKLLG